MISHDRDRPRRPARSLPSALRDGARLRRWFEAVEAGQSTGDACYEVGVNVVAAVYEARRVLRDPEATARLTAPEVEVMRAVVERYTAAVRPSGYQPRPASEETCEAVLEALEAAGR